MRLIPCAIFESVPENIDYKRAQGSGLMVQGAGNSSAEIQYSNTDDRPISGNSYYRLSQTDFDGKHEIFNTILINVSSGSQAEPFSITSVSPVPFRDKIHVEFHTKQERIVELWLLDANGKVISRNRMMAGKGVNSLDWNDLGILNSGTYMVYIISEGKSPSARKIIK